MQYNLYALGPKNMPNLRFISSGSRAEVNKEMTSRRQVDSKTEYAVYDDGGRLLSSTFSGGANPHAWGLRSAGESRKTSGLVRRR